MERKFQALKFVMADFVYGWRRRLRPYGVVKYLAIEEMEGKEFCDFYEK